MNYTRIKAKQFRYDNGDARQRYMTRELDAAALPTITPLATPKGQWVEYDGSMPYADGEYTHGTSGSHSVTKQYDPMSEKVVSGGAEVHRHGDLIGSTVATTDAAESNIARQAYSAFGEPVGSSTVNTRYRYAGAFGYEDGLLYLDGAANTQPVVLLHLGERWCQPGIGRFVQRDPIGVVAGVNVYVYCANNPIVGLDATGEWLHIVLGGAIGAAIGGTAAWLNGDNILIGAGAGAVGGAVAAGTFGLLGGAAGATGLLGGTAGGTVIAGALAGGAGGFAQSATTQICLRQWDWRDIAWGTALGGVFGLFTGLGSVADDVGDNIGPPLFTVITKSYEFVAEQARRHWN